MRQDILETSGAEVPRMHEPSTAQIVIVSIALAILAAAFFVMLTSAVQAHDIWINRLRLKNPAGEWCCGARDCGIVASNAVVAGRDGYRVNGFVAYGSSITKNKLDGKLSYERIRETVPYHQVQPSPDGAYWRCKRPDGSRRCFFAPPPGS